jgi:magnesium-transporting ATPase (P-type)
MKRIQKKIAAGTALAAGELALLSTSVFAAVNPKTKVQEGVTAAGGDPAATTSLNTLIQNVINVLLFIIGAIAVIMIIVGGIEYVTSAGDPAKTKKAKDTILYSIVGLVIALLAYAIVNFVLTNL